MNASYMFPDPGTFANTASVSCTPKGVLEQRSRKMDSVTVIVHGHRRRSLAVVKTGDAFSKVGDAVSYTITISNVGDIDGQSDCHPAITCWVITRPTLPTSASERACEVNLPAVLAAGASCAITATRHHAGWRVQIRS